MTGCRAIPNKDYIDDVFSIFDIDKDGEVSFDE